MALLLLFFFFSLIFANDVVAYLAGRYLGGAKKLGLRISPAKTAVGFLSGFLASVAVAVAFHLGLPDVVAAPWPIVLVFGAAMGFSTIMGDLVESALKRSAGVKDSGRLVPGMGGILDVVDSMLLSLPIFYHFFYSVVQ